MPSEVPTTVDLPFTVTWLDGNFQPIVSVSQRAIDEAGAITRAAGDHWIEARSRARLSRGGVDLGMWVIEQRPASQVIRRVAL